ncbi:MAG: DUF2304 family protein [Desulfobacterales bacterium]|nr:DUF2304 family protein [Desulfobacterales bacterium]
MSNLRLFGLVVGILGLLFTFFKYRGPRWNRANFILSAMFNICVITISVNPNSVNFARDLLALEKYQYGRIIALLIFSNIFLLFFAFYNKSKQNNITIQIDKLVRGLGAIDIKKSIEDQSKFKPIMIVIPAYNEADNLNVLLPKIPSQINGMDVGVLVVDDGSDDETINVVRSHNHFAVANIINRGGGAALRLGYDVLKNGGAKICITMDADGQHQPEEIEKLIIPIIDDQYDFVIGSRILGNREKDSLFRLVGIHTFGIVISSLLGKKITDPSSGFRAFKTEGIDSINLYEDQYHTSELIIEAIKKGMRIGEVPITILKRKYGKSKKGRNWLYGLYFARTVISTWWRAK